jgi:hypothetical protein
MADLLKSVNINSVFRVVTGRHLTAAIILPPGPLPVGQPVGPRMMRLQRCESGPYFADFSLHIPDMRVEIVKICPRSPIVSLSHT